MKELTKQNKKNKLTRLLKQNKQTTKEQKIKELAKQGKQNTGFPDILINMINDLLVCHKKKCIPYII